ncbi:lycopene cyclase family protein [Flavobacterium hibernum]|uniref:Lycopene cyclase n=1 Tax=Flavobacterium hibernum TaxID=37752 RepID=A0A0D0EJ06_9FLAO|nr:lycopene cyclase family protein [Flavobacterium hibernum]KIO50650.1 lycopene cyclase [Flavobacterium hibernum]OXA87518.1 lycopene cyclase [Flavobacterium hibernum]STO14390.1 lycopene cyclase family protein [Flavobacterium hibernum]
MTSSQIKHFDYIFTGTGLAALMTAYKMIVSGKFSDKSILLLDQNLKKTNDRTWCFWDKEDSMWSSIISKKWDSALFANEEFKRDLALKPYSYNKINGLDFYNFVFETISNQSNITFLNEKVTDINELETHVFVGTEENRYTCNYLFNSIYTKAFAESQTKYPVLQQHFIGWFVKTGSEVFNPEQATFMDFSVEQKRNTRFMYVLPSSKTEALVEYTLFSEKLLSKEEYENEIKIYLEKLGVNQYEIVEKEQGSIPMTCYPFWQKNTKRVLNIGTAGGWTKASTGYTFKNSDKNSSKLVDFIYDFEVSGSLMMKAFYKKNRFWFYDLLLLDILYRHNELGSSIFSSLFRKGNPALIFKFLDEETSFLEDVKVILKCPKIPFIKALFRVIFLSNKSDQNH